MYVALEHDRADGQLAPGNHPGQAREPIPFRTIAVELDERVMNYGPGHALVVRTEENLVKRDTEPRRFSRYSVSRYSSDTAGGDTADTCTADTAADTTTDTANTVEIQQWTTAFGCVRTVPVIYTP
eukprot:22667-Prymnesium_polylepis.1